MIQIQAPDGTIIQFPAGTDDATIDRVMRQAFSPDTADSQLPEFPPVAGSLLDFPQEPAPEPQEEVGGWDAFKRGFSDLATFGTADEVSGYINSLISGQPYEEERDKLRQGLENAREQRPWTTAAGGLTGGALQSIFTAGLMGGPSAATTGARAVQGAKLGALEGLAYGAGSGEGAGDRLAQAAKHGVVGGAVGAAAPIAVEGARRGYRALANPMSNLMNKANPTLASEAVHSGLQRAGMSADDVTTALQAAAREGQPDFRIADAMGTPGQRMLSGIARQPGDAGADIAQFLQQRQLDQPNRVAGFVEDAFGFRGTPQGAPGTDLITPAEVLRRPQRSAAGLVDDLTSARNVIADEAYDAARNAAAPVDVRGVLSAIDDRIGPMQGSGIRGDGIDGILSRYRSRLASQPGGPAFEGASSVELADFSRVLGVKQSLQDDIGQAVRAGRNNQARELGKIVSQLDEALEASSIGYRQANDGFREASRVIDAVDQGAEMIRPGARSTDTTAAFRAMNPEQQAAARVGYGDRALARMEAGSSPSTNRAKAFTSSKAATEADAMAINPELFQRRIGRENQMWETFNRGLGGSRTADNLADIGDTSSMATGVLGNLFAGRILEAGRQAGVGIANNLTGRSDATRALIAEMLMGRDVPAAVQPALRALERRTAVSKPLEALARSGGRMMQDYLSR